MLLLRFWHVRQETRSVAAHGQATALQRVVRGAAHDIAVTVADTSAKQERGLSGTAPLASLTGMWFAFDAPRPYGFWMKDMKYALDIVWISAEGKVIFIAPGLTPASYPTVVYPPSPALSVLEIGSGEAAREGIVIGTTLTLSR